jgi:PAS domain S-box-containing protein
MNESGGANWDAERLSLVLAASGMGDWSWDAATDIVTCSARAAEIFGIPPGPQLTWTAMRELLHPDDRERARLAVLGAIETRGDYAIEYRLINGGRERRVLASGRARYDERGHALGMLGVVQDLTRDRVLLLLDDAVRPLVDPELITYTAARELGQHLRVNRCAYAFVEDDQDTFLLTGNYTNGVDSIVGRYRFRQFGAECLRLMRAGLPYIVEDSQIDSRLEPADRTSYEVTAIRAVICVPILKAGRFVGAMAVHTREPRSWSAAEVDLVQQVASRCWESIERARIEREREALLHAAEAANRAKDEFMAMLGHELRNPLAPMVTALHLMKQEGTDTFLRERTVIERQVNHLTRLVDDLLDVSRIAQGKVQLKLELVELSEIITRAAEMASPLLEQHAHTLTIDVARTGLRLRADVLRLTQVVSNLLTNAAKYTPSGGRIGISAQAQGDELSLYVRDDGIGMTPEVLAQAFDAFVQGKQSIDRAHGGLGLGLAIVRSLVQRHGGSVSAHSAGPGEGSEFIVRLPRASQQEAVPSDTARPDQSDLCLPSSPHILVVDDNDDAADMLARVLAAQGCRVVVAHDGLVALQLTAGHSFDGALLDIGLPVMDGYELARRLRALPAFANARLIAVTGYGQESDRQRSAAAGFCEHLVKPVSIEQLTRIVASLRQGGGPPGSS